MRASLEYAPNLGRTTEAWKAVRTLQETLYGLKPGVFGERSQFCMTKVDVALGFGTGRYFVNQTFPGESREKATQVIDSEPRTDFALGVLLTFIGQTSSMLLRDLYAASNGWMRSLHVKLPRKPKLFASRSASLYPQIHVIHVPLSPTTPS